MKCLRCNIDKPNSEFYKNNSRSTGLDCYCKDCNRLRYRQRRVNNIKTHKKKDKVYYQSHRKEILNKRSEYSKVNFHKISARGKVNYAIKKGDIVKPESCSQCGSASKLDAHHHDYNKPLDVIWLCRKCHQILHNGK